MEPWDPRINTRLGLIQRASTEKEYYGPVCSILTESFPLHENYMVYPQAYPLHLRDSIDFMIEYLVELIAGNPVFGVEIKRATDYDSVQKRIDADQQMRERFVSLHSSIRLPTMYMVSMIGTRCCVYSYDTLTRQITPPEIMPTDRTRVEDLAPAERWAIDISTLEGRQQLNNVFNLVKQLVQHNLAP
jgi:hypothetical protein